MTHIKYFLQFIITIKFFIVFKILGVNNASSLGGKIFEIIGPYFRSKKIIYSNIKKAFPDKDEKSIKKIIKLMWNNYGRTFAEYMYIKDFRFNQLSSNIKIEGKEVLDEIKKNNTQVIFISGHLSNFELMAMYLEKSGIKLSTIYRPLNNIFLNKIMETLRRKYICKNQVKKGIGGLKNLLNYKKKNFSTALMIDQRVSEGILSNFFNHKALTTTIPAQLVKKFNIPVVPIEIERTNGVNFKIIINQPLNFSNNDSIQYITDQLNKILEIMITKNPDQWIWTHNRWK